MTIKEYLHIFKRFFITFLICLPILFGIGILLVNKVHNAVMITIFVVVMGTGFVLEELWYSNHKKKMEERRKQAKAKRDLLKIKRLVESLEKQKQDQQNSNKKNNKKRDKS